MKSIVFFNNKGGVGKTTLLCNVSAFIAIELKKKVLVIDADPQCNATTYVLDNDTLDSIYAKQKRQTIDHFIQPITRGKGDSLTKIEPLKSMNFGFDIIPGDPKLAISEDTMATDWKDAVAGVERGLQTTYMFRLITELYSDYDYIFFDVGPSLGAINRSILIGSDYFIVPMSVDLFSVMAIDNINVSLTKWKTSIKRGLEDYFENEGHRYTINNKVQDWNLKFCGYVMQQYIAKVEKGEKKHVKAFEKISKEIPIKIQSHMVSHYVDDRETYEPLLGEVENLYSLIPMSQTSKTPVFLLKSRDGVVGAHFAKVISARNLYEKISMNILKNIGDI